ncbi:hypothetical protein GCM10011324_31620 [Allosediminivita pacifica]|nr:hypothetical protein GCM10011324_31620 [Allosediminivita pacifica]
MGGRIQRAETGRRGAGPLGAARGHGGNGWRPETRPRARRLSGHFPEFLRESTAIEDYYDPGLIVSGSHDDKTETFLTDLNRDLSCEMSRGPRALHY